MYYQTFINQTNSNVTTEALRNHLKTRFLTSISANTNKDTITQLTTALIASIICIPELKISVCTTHASRDLWSQARLYNYPIEDLATTTKVLGYTTPEQFIHSRITGKVMPQTPDMQHIHIIQTSSGFNNIQAFLKKVGYNEEPVNFKTKLNNKIRANIYKIKNNIYLLYSIPFSTEDDSSIIRILTGCLPILLNDIFYKYMAEYKELCSYFEDCYDNKRPNPQTLSALKPIQDLSVTLKKLRFKNRLLLIEDNIRAEQTNLINTLKNNIKDTEDKLIAYYKSLDIAEKTNITNELIKDKQLLLQFLTNNPTIKDIIPHGNTVTIKSYGPVNYNKETFKKTTKSFNTDFIDIMTYEDFELYWESVCTIDLKTYVITSIRDKYNPIDYLPNTHWYYYNCFGNNIAPIVKALKNNDYLSVFMISATAAQNLNVYDMTVLTKLKSKLFDDYYYYPTIYDKKLQKFITVADALKTIKNKEKE